jgi:hypothetical protein
VGGHFDTLILRLCNLGHSWRRITLAQRGLTSFTPGKMAQKIYWAMVIGAK